MTISDDVVKSFFEILPPLFATLVPLVIPLVILIKQGRQDKKLERIEETGEATHALSNSSYGVALRLNAANSKWRADMSGKPEDIQAAEYAANLLKKHEENQAAIDAEIKTQKESL